MPASLPTPPATNKLAARERQRLLAAIYVPLTPSNPVFVYRFDRTAYPLEGQPL